MRYMHYVFLGLIIALPLSAHSQTCTKFDNDYNIIEYECGTDVGAERIDAIDKDGNTALCRAILNNDTETYLILEKQGANTNHKCVGKIPSEKYAAFMKELENVHTSWGFSSLGNIKGGVIGLGAVGVAATVALASGIGGDGGSGGGAGSSNNNTISSSDQLCNDQGYTYRLNDSCPDGWVKNNNDHCTNDDATAVWYKCNVPATCSSDYKQNCPNGYEEVVGDICQSGTTVYKRCKAATCEGFDYTNESQCKKGWKLGASCLSGVTTKYKCELIQCGYTTTKCTGGYVETGNTCQSGETLYKECMPRTCDYSTTECSGGYQYTGNTCKSGEVLYKECTQVQCGANAIWSESGCSCEEGYENWKPGVGCSQILLECGENAHPKTGTVCQCEAGYENWVDGVGCSLTPLQCGANAHQSGTQCQCNDGYENWVEGTGCSLIPRACGANAHQEETECKCDNGYTSWTSDVGCYPVSCGANASQVGTMCVCNPGYSNFMIGVGCSANKVCAENQYYKNGECVCKSGYQLNNGVCESVQLNCGANATQQGEYCQCDLGYTNWTEGIGCFIVLDCGLHAYQDAATCKCELGYDNWVSGLGCSAYGILNTTNQYNSYLSDSTNDDFYALVHDESMTSLNNVTNERTGLYVTKNGNGNTFGLFSTSSSGIYNSTSSYTNGPGVISMKKDGLGDLYAMFRQNTTSCGDSGCIMANSLSEHFASLDDSDTVKEATGYIIVENNGAGKIYGLAQMSNVESQVINAYVRSDHRLPAKATGVITINNKNNDKDVYGIYAANTYGKVSNAYADYPVRDIKDAYGVIQITNYGAGNVYGIMSEAVDTDNASTGTGIINITNYGDGNVYGITSTTRSAFNASDGGTGIINIINYGTGTSYGIYDGVNVVHPNTTGIISIRNKGIGNAIGVVKNNGASYSYNGAIDKKNIVNYSSGKVFGMYGGVVEHVKGSVDSQVEINLRNLADGEATGIYAKTDGKADNSGTININNVGSGTAIGIFGDSGSKITNSGVINITRDSYFDEDSVLYTPNGTAGDVFGIYAKSGSTVKNTGTINITSNGNMYGIYAESSSTVTNTGTISLNGVSCSGADCDTGNYIVLNGSTLYNSGIMSASQMNLNSMGGDVVAGIGSRFVIDNDFSGNLNISSEWVQDGNQTTYIAENTIEAGDISGLNVRSASAMFDASIADNGHDVIMQMKDFDSLTDNKSLAAFLANNYAKGNGNDLFNALKSIGDMTTFNGALSGLTGVDAFTQFAHEDLSAMREISFSMNNKLFENSGRDNFDVSDNMAYFSFSNSRNGGSGQYGISSAKIGENLKLGYGMAMANINTGDDSGMHRQNKLWLFYMPATYTADGYELVVAPKAGFAHSEYNRRGYNNINYDGQIEKRIFELMNDLRYPLSVGNWTVAPDLAFNTIVYTQSGHEDAQAFGLIIPDDRTVSVETGLGFYTKYEKNLTDGGRLKLNSGLMAYREFGNAYDIKLGIRGLDGTFSLYNNDYEYRGAASMGFDYVSGRLHLYGDAQYFMDNNRYMNFKGGFAFRF